MIIEMESCPHCRHFNNRSKEPYNCQHCKFYIEKRESLAESFLKHLNSEKKDQVFNIPHCATCFCNNKLGSGINN